MKTKLFALIAVFSLVLLQGCAKQSVFSTAEDTQLKTVIITKSVEKQLSVEDKEVKLAEQSRFTDGEIQELQIGGTVSVGSTSVVNIED